MVLLLDAHTRVRLRQVGSNVLSKYTNANYIDVRRPISHYTHHDMLARIAVNLTRFSHSQGYDNQKKNYIACQGPLDSTMDDFWRMMWEQQSNVIIMVTNLKEGGRSKCAQYWPDLHQQKLYGEFYVKNTETKLRNGYVVNLLSVHSSRKV